MLLLDLGNRRLKWGVWQNGMLGVTRAEVYDPDNLPAQLEQWFEQGPQSDSALVCSVASAGVNASLQDWITGHGARPPRFMSSRAQQCGVINRYRQPQQLGVDRWMAMIAAHARFSRDLCVISCGSAITIDVVKADGQHQGGLILPGLGMMRQALLSNAVGINVAAGRRVELADNTADAVYSGCFNIAAAGLRQLINDYRKTYGAEMQCVMTGGDGQALASAMGENCCVDTDLILKGVALAAGDS